jgi:hypothetical protein
MLDFTRHDDMPCLRLPLLHDDVDRVFDCISRRASTRARRQQGLDGRAHQER